MSNEIQNLQNEVNNLKIRAYDLTEMVGRKDVELRNYSQLLGQICQVLEIDGSQGVTPEAIIGALHALKDSTQKGDDEEGSAAEQLLQE
ncbi:hypothetical protein PHYNN_250 [Pantoea phage Phynn]|nr:hypothetical protein PHYNN_250 [Pantoea phage Phynn]